MMESVPERRRNSSEKTDGHRLHAFGVAPVGIGAVWGGCIDPRGLSGTRHYYTMPNGKVKRPANFFSIFFGGAGGRPVGRLWPLAVGGKEKAPDIG